MKTIYSILYLNLNTTLNEKVSIGVVMSDGIKEYFKYSSEKLSIFKHIIDDESYGFVKSYVKSIEKEIGVKSNSSNTLFKQKEGHYNWVNKSYIAYLSRYSNNIIQFDSPKTIDVELNNNTFKKIFEKYIFNYTENLKVNIPIDIHLKVKDNLLPKIKSRVNIERTLTSEDFENLFAPIEIDFIGINGIPVAGQTVNFEKNHHNLENDVTRFISLTKAIELEGQGRNNLGKYFVLGREPQKVMDKNHSLWEQIKGSDFLEFVDIDEVDIVQEYIEKNNVKPFFTE